MREMYSLTVLEAISSTSNCQKGLVPLRPWGSILRILPPPVLASGGCGHPWRSLARSCIIPIPTTVVTCTSSLCLCILSPYYKDTIILDLGLPLIQYYLTLPNYKGKDPISKEGHVLRFQRACILGDTIQDSTDA